MAPVISRLWQISSTIKTGPYHSVIRSLGRKEKNSVYKLFSKVTEKQEVSQESVHFRKLLKPLIFTACFSGSSFAVAAIWKYENMRRQASEFYEKQWNWWKKEPVYKMGKVRQKVNTWWNSQTEGQKVAWGIIALNAFVSLLWHVPALQPTMIKYFCSNLASQAVCWPMLLSTFSHFSWIHWAVNMYVLHSFSSVSMTMFGKEQFLALYLSAGVISSFVSYIHKFTTGKMSLSLGASGALLTIIAATCVQYPDSQLTIVFLPFFTFSAGTAIKAVMALDTVGILMGWKLFDHAAHLGGSIFGIFYVLYGQEYIWNRRASIIKPWHEWREGVKK